MRPVKFPRPKNHKLAKNYELRLLGDGSRTDSVKLPVKVNLPLPHDQAGSSGYEDIAM